MSENNETFDPTAEPVAEQPAAEAVVETAPAVDETASAADPVDNAAVVEPAGDPTVLEAEAMFAENPGLSAVVTDQGTLLRDGILIRIPVARGE